jgi:hypothetical protein
VVFGVGHGDDGWVVGKRLLATPPRDSLFLYSSAETPKHEF